MSGWSGNVSSVNLPAAQPAVKYHGLMNQGSTCYLNSVLQVLFMTREFREAVIRFVSENPDSESIDRDLKDLFDDLLERETYTYKITRTLGITRVYEHQDAAQYFERILRLTSPNAAKIFHGQMAHRTTCSVCRRENDRHEPFWHLPLELADSSSGNFSVEEGIQRFFTGTHFSGDDQMYCDCCDAKVDATSRYVIKHHPDVLILLLKRFDFNYKSMSYSKIKCAVDVPHTLKIPEKQTYELYAVVDHSGDLISGHYVATIRPQSEDRWYSFDDSRVSQLHHNLFPDNETTSSTSAYLLFYRQRVDAADTSEERKEGEIKETGSKTRKRPLDTKSDDDYSGLSKKKPCDFSGDSEKSAVPAADDEQGEICDVQRIKMDNTTGINKPTEDKEEHNTGKSDSQSLKETGKDEDSDDQEEEGDKLSDEDQPEVDPEKITVAEDEHGEMINTQSLPTDETTDENNQSEDEETHEAEKSKYNNNNDLDLKPRGRERSAENEGKYEIIEAQRIMNRTTSIDKPTEEKEEQEPGNSDSQSQKETGKDEDSDDQEEEGDQLSDEDQPEVHPEEAVLTETKEKIHGDDERSSVPAADDGQDEMIKAQTLPTDVTTDEAKQSEDKEAPESEKLEPKADRDFESRDSQRSAEQNREDEKRNVQVVFTDRTGSENKETEERTDRSGSPSEEMREKEKYTDEQEDLKNIMDLTNKQPTEISDGLRTMKDTTGSENKRTEEKKEQETGNSDSQSQKETGKDEDSDDQEEEGDKLSDEDQPEVHPEEAALTETKEQKHEDGERSYVPAADDGQSEMINTQMLQINETTDENKQSEDKEAPESEKLGPNYELDFESGDRERSAEHNGLDKRSLSQQELTDKKPEEEILKQMSENQDEKRAQISNGEQNEEKDAEKTDLTETEEKKDEDSQTSAPHERQDEISDGQRLQMDKTRGIKGTEERTYISGSPSEEMREKDKNTDEQEDLKNLLDLTNKQPTEMSGQKMVKDTTGSENKQTEEEEEREPGNSDSQSQTKTVKDEDSDDQEEERDQLSDEDQPEVHPEEAELTETKEQKHEDGERSSVPAADDEKDEMIKAQMLPTDVTTNENKQSEDEGTHETKRSNGPVEEVTVKDEDTDDLKETRTLLSAEDQSEVMDPETADPPEAEEMKPGEEPNVKLSGSKDSAGPTVIYKKLRVRDEERKLGNVMIEEKKRGTGVKRVEDVIVKVDDPEVTKGLLSAEGQTGLKDPENLSEAAPTGLWAKYKYYILIGVVTVFLAICILAAVLIFPYLDH